MELLYGMVWCLGLGVLGWMDARTRRVPVWCLGLCGVWGLVGLFWLPKEPVQALLGLGIGLFFCGICLITREAIGWADALVLLSLSIGLPLAGFITLLMFALLGIMLAAIWLFGRKKLGRKGRIPFLPFVAIGYPAACWLLGGVV